jgi:gluconolactonase
MTLLPIALEQFQKIAVGIDRPEDVVVLADGRIYATDHQCTVAQIHMDGSFTRLGPRGGAPNGLNADRHGRLIIANFGIYDEGEGPLQRFDPISGHHETLVAEIDGQRLTSCNYPVIDRAGNIWCTHSTFAPTWMLALLDRRADGFVFVVPADGSAPRIVADGIAFANGCCLDADERYLYVNRTSMCDVVRYPILQGARLGPIEKVCDPLGPHIPFPPPEGFTGEPDASVGLGYTDGNGFDAEGNLWVTLPAANKIVAIRPSGEVVTIAVDVSGSIINHPTNVSFGGQDQCDLYIGSIRANYVLKARTPVAGLAMVHQR